MKAGVSLGSEWIAPTPLNVPNRLSATAIAHRSVAQNGQYSAPTYSTSGFPLEVSGDAVTGLSMFGNEVPLPTAASVLAGTLATLCTTLVSWPPDSCELDALRGEELAASGMPVRAPTTAITTTMLPA